MARIKGLWLDFADWRRHTAYLTQEEKGAIIDLMIAAAEREGRLQNDQTLLKFVSKLSSRTFRNFFPKFAEIFKQNGDGCWHNETVDHQIERTEKIREARQAAGEAGAKKRWQDDSKEHSNPIANAMANATELPSSEMANHMANASLNLESVKPYEPNGSKGLSPPIAPPSKPRGGRRAKRVYVPSPREVQIEGFAHALAERARNRNC